MSLYHTALSTAQGQPGAAVPGVFVGCVKMHRLLLQCADDAAAVGAAQPLSAAAVAASWFVLGRCLLQLSEQLELCLSEPGSYRLSAWFLASARVWDCSCSTVDQQGIDKQLKELVDALLLLAAAAMQWGRSLGHQKEVINNSSSSSSRTATLWLKHYQLYIMPAWLCLHEDLCDSFRALSEVWALALDPAFANDCSEQQLQQLKQGPAWQSFIAIDGASRELKEAGDLLCAALPNRYFCNNPGCRNAAGVSAGFGLVRGAACVCGGCVGSEGAAGAAAAPQEAVAAR